MSFRNPKFRKLSLIFLLLAAAVLTACNLATTPPATPQVETVVFTLEVTRQVEVEVEVTRVVEVPVTITPSPTPEISPTTTLTPTITQIPTITPTAAPPRAKVLERTNCRYGPGAAYLYKYGLYPGNRMEIIGRNELGTWVYLQAIGGNNPCWAKADLLEVDGDLFSVAPYYNKLPYSELYQPPTGVGAVRAGDQVTVSWVPVWMTEDDYRGYLIEAWVCQEGQIVFTPVHIDGTVVAITDEAGCQQPSSGRLYTAEKHGYTKWVPIPWPDQE